MSEIDILSLNMLDVYVNDDDFKNGIRQSSHSCPIALAVKRHLGVDLKVHIDQTGLLMANLRDQDGEKLVEYAYHPLTSEAEDFINNYDAGEEFGGCNPLQGIRIFKVQTRIPDSDIE